jgi:fatty-acyl-CoA synthase
VAEAAVVAVPHAKWLERPLAAVVAREGRAPAREALLEFLADRFPRWWLPDDVVFVASIPRTSTGKFLKSVLRAGLRDHYGGSP